MRMKHTLTIGVARWALPLVATLAIVLLPQVAGRAAAVRQPLIFSIPPGPDVTVRHLCEFPVLVHGTGWGIVHVYFGEAGDFERLIITEPAVTLTFTNLNTGVSVWTPSVNMIEETANPDGTGTKTLRGLLDHIIVPGEGLVEADVGRIDYLFTFDDQGNIMSEQTVFTAGRQDGEFDAVLCSVLG
jgi:hypothetical protein